MDFNGLYNDGAVNNGPVPAALPLGFGMALAMNEKAMAAYAELTESQKEQIIHRCKDAKSKEEMRKIVNSLVPDGNANSLVEGPKTN